VGGGREGEREREGRREEDGRRERERIPQPFQTSALQCQCCTGASSKAPLTHVALVVILGVGHVGLSTDSGNFRDLQ
jgi:hypothetical protein